MENKILPIVVIYRCQLEESKAYQTLILPNKFADFVVYDNSPADYEQREGMIPSNAHYYHDAENGGLSKAYNYGAKIAADLKYEWLLLLDQDTEFPEEAMCLYTQYTNWEMMLVPNVVLADGESFSPSLKTWGGMKPVILDEGVYHLKHFSAINSGCCVPLSAFLEAGGYKEDVRLDFSDYQFQRRLCKVQNSFYVLPLEVHQDFSNETSDVSKLEKRFLQYLDCALHCDCDGFAERMSLHKQVLQHSMALFLRTRKKFFISSYLKKYILHR